MQIALCSCACSGAIPQDRVAALRAVLDDCGHCVTIIDDLCQLAAEDPAKAGQLVEKTDALVACHPRAIQWLLQRAGITLSTQQVQLHDLHIETAEQVAEALGLTQPESCEAAPLAKSDWEAWYPVIDYDRCSNCGQCHDFCLFGVYTRERHKVAVTAPENCKTNCPACAKVCPQVAIIFPKCGEEPINGADIDDESIARQQARTSAQEMLGSDIYSALQKRKQRAKKRLLK